MRLLDLNGQFVYEVDARGYRRSEGNSLEGMQGVMFQCPKCGEGHPRAFSNPIGVTPTPENAHPRKDGTPNPRWKIESGSSLEDLTLSPSINCDIPWKDEQGVEHTSDCKFHGFVRGGDAA